MIYLNPKSPTEKSIKTQADDINIEQFRIFIANEDQDIMVLCPYGKYED